MNGQLSIAHLLESLHLARDEEQRRVWAVNCAHALGLDGIAISLGEELLWFSDATSARLEDMQFVIGQGPSLLLPEGEGLREIPDVDRLLMRHWPQFVPEAQALSVAAVFVWPAHVGGGPDRDADRLPAHDRCIELPAALGGLADRRHTGRVHAGALARHR